MGIELKLELNLESGTFFDLFTRSNLNEWNQSRRLLEFEKEDTKQFFNNCERGFVKLQNVNLLKLQKQSSDIYPYRQVKLRSRKRINLSRTKDIPELCSLFNDLTKSLKNLYEFT